MKTKNDLFTLSEQETIKRFLEQQEFLSLKLSDDFIDKSDSEFNLFVCEANYVIEVLLHRNSCSITPEKYAEQTKNHNRKLNLIDQR